MLNQDDVVMPGDRNFVQQVLRRVSSRGDRTAQIDAKTGKRLSYKDVNRMVNNVAYMLQSEGIGPGSVVAVCSENCLEYVGVVFGILKAGAIATLYSPGYISRELKHIISITKPKVLFTTKLSKEHQNVIDTYSEIKILKWSLKEIMEGKEKPKPVPGHFTDGSHTAFLLSSSGSTGLPKAVTLTHSNIMWFLKYSELSMKPDEAALGLMPFFHAYGLGLMLMALWEDSPLVVMSKFTPEDFSSALITYKVKRLHIVSSFLIKLVNGSINPKCLRGLHAVYTAAGNVVPQVQSAVLDLLEPGGKIYHGYGMTEATNVMCVGEMRPDKPVSSGPPFSCMKIKIIGSNGETLPAGVKGELCIYGPMVMPGYCGNPTANSVTFTEDGWLKSGDLAWIDDDGWVYIVDRLKDIIKFQGYQISVSEIEQIISEQPGVSEVAVVGVPHEIYGEVPRAFVVPKEDEKPSEEDIIEAVKRELSHYKWLRGGVRFIESLPKTHSMKLFRKGLRGLP